MYGVLRLAGQGENCFSGVIEGKLDDPPIMALGTTGLIGDRETMIQVRERGRRGERTMDKAAAAAAVCAYSLCWIKWPAGV